MAFGDFTVVRSTVKRALNSSGVLAEVAVNTPAFEFNADGTYKGLLVEPAATNLLLYSQEFDNAAWTKNNLNTTGTPAWVNAVTAPDGTTTADKIIPDGITNALAQLTQAVTTSIGVNTFSIYLKEGGYNWSEIAIQGTGVTTARVWFDLQNGVVGTVEAGIDNPKIEQVGDGWYRCSFSFTSSGTGSVNYFIYATTRDGLPEFTGIEGDGTSGVYLWGAQLETGSVATSYIPTTGSTANRTADDISLSSASSLIGQGEGTLYCEVDVNVYPVAGVPIVGILSISVADSLDNVIFIGINRNTDNQIYGLVQSGGGTTVSIVSGNITAGVHKIALGYKVNDYVLYVDGVQIGTDVSGALPVGTIANIHIGQRHASDAQRLGDHVKAVALFPTKLSNAQLASLTT